VAIADSGSFRAAAQTCHVSQPSLSAQVAQAESALGVRIFERDRRSVRLTRAGERLLPALRATLVAADDVVTIARNLEDPLHGTFRLGVIPTVAPYLLPGLSTELRRRFPRLTVLWREERTAALVAAIEAGELDGALLALEAPLGGLHKAVLGPDPFLLCAPAEHPLSRGRGRVPLEALDDSAMLVLDEGHCLRDQALAACGASGADIHEADFRATSLGTLVQMVASGAGVTLLPQLAAPVEASRAPVVTRRFRTPEPGRTIGFVYRAQSALAPALQEVAGVLQAAYARRASG
jgi:LysR family hydrogen peroxide-inducible transcriptional activator